MTRRRRKDSQHLNDAAEHLQVLREHLARGSLDDVLIRDAVSHRLEVAIDAVAKVATAGISSSQFPRVAPHCQRIDTTAEDRTRGDNRAEYLRQHVKTDDGGSVYDRCYGWREDSESLNNTLDRTPYGGRMIAYAVVRHMTVMLGFALGRNAIAAYPHRRRHPGERAA
jgi:hypothetical protein